MAKTNIEFLSLLNSRLTLARKFAKKWLQDVKKWLKSYDVESIEDIKSEDLHNKLQVPYIFSTVESALPSIFNTFPSLIIKGRGKDDVEFGEFVSRVWEYIYDKTQMEEKIENAGTMFLLTGVGQMGTGWITETETVEETNSQPITNSDGSPVLDENGQPVSEEIISKYDVPIKDLPVVDFKDYRKILYSPESEFVIDDTENKIPYVIEEKNMIPEEVKEKYGVEVKAETFLDVSDIDKNMKVDDRDLDKEDLKRVAVFEYSGILPKKFSGDKDWKSGRIYKVCFTKDKILKDPEKIDKKRIYQVGNYGVPTKFFKFGEPKTLYDLEMDVSYGRSTMIDYRDKFATKLFLDTASEYDERQLKSPKKFAIVKGQKPPAYITPPPLPETVIMGINQSRQDISMTSAQLDIGRGGDVTTVETATGQKIFQQAQDKRIERKKRKIAKFIEAIAKDVLTDCGSQWDPETFAKIVDADAEDPKFLSYVEKMKTLGDEWNIEIEPETVVSNKEVMGAQSIAMYREMKEDPLVNRAELIKEAIKNGFNRKNVEQFLSQQLSPEQLQQVLEMLIQNGVIDPNSAEVFLQQYIQTQIQPPGQNVGRPPTTNPAEIVKKSMPGADQTQIAAQTEAAPQQTGVYRGPQNV
jgi:hypothetical protein